jgi:hypothetical protein
MIIIHGRYVTQRDALRTFGWKRDSSCSFHLDHANSIICKIRHLQSIGQWDVDFDWFSQPDQVKIHLLEHERKQRWSMLREYDHYDYHEDEQRMGCQHVIKMKQHLPGKLRTKSSLTLRTRGPCFGQLAPHLQQKSPSQLQGCLGAPLLRTQV